MKIEILPGYFIQVDEEDAERIQSVRWYVGHMTPRGPYIVKRVRINKKNIFTGLQRFIMDVHDRRCVTFRNMKDVTDYRKSNLMVCKRIDALNYHYENSLRERSAVNR